MEEVPSPTRKLRVNRGNLHGLFFFSLHADFSIFPPVESVFRFLITTSHREWRRANRRLECGRSIRA
jgi:hypothetical protein